MFLEGSSNKRLVDSLRKPQSKCWCSLASRIPFILTIELSDKKRKSEYTEIQRKAAGGVGNDHHSKKKLLLSLK